MSRPIIGNTTATPNPRPDWNQTDSKKADFIKNKPIENGEAINSIQSSNLNTKAISEGSIALGSNSIAGCKGYRYQALCLSTDKNPKLIKIYLSNETSIPTSSPIKLTPDDDDQDYINKGFETPPYKIYKEGTTELANVEIAIYDDNYHYFCGIIGSIENNVVTLKEPVEFNYIVPDKSLENDSYIFFVPSQPDIGIITFATGGTALGKESKASGENSVAEGFQTQSAGKASHAEGRQTKAGLYAHAEGYLTRATGQSAHSEGNQTEATANYAHAEGNGTRATKTAAHAEGNGSQATGQYAHAEGNGTLASTTAAHAEGETTSARAIGSHAEGLGTSVNPQARYQHVQGKYNKEDTTGEFAHIVGNGDGPSSTQRKNIHTLAWTGDAWYAGHVFIGEKNEQLATESYVTSAIEKLVNAAPGALDTLGELAKALNNDKDFATTVTNALASKADKTELDDLKITADIIDDVLVLKKGE